MMQPILPTNPYLVQQQTSYIPVAPQQPQPNYNAVKIDVHNPSVSAPSMPYAPQSMPQPQYAPVTNPYYTYPQATLYDYPQAPQNVQPYYMPQNISYPQPTQAYVTPGMVLPAQNAINNSIAAEQAAQSVLSAVTPQVQQQNINAPQDVKAPEPVVTAPVSEPAKAAEAKAPEVVPPAPITPQVDLNSFISKLTNPDYEVQAATMEEIANMVKNDPSKATELLDEKVVSALLNIMNADTSKLEGPSAEQLAARQKMLSGQSLTDAEQKLANTITPMELAERNKSYAMFTTSIMQKLFGDEVQKLANTTVPLTELPGAVNIVEQLKDNPNPMVRTSAIESLSYIQRPEYKEDLKTLFEIAQNDKDKGVQETAKVALQKLNEMPAADTQKTAKTVEMKPQQVAQAA